jgi:hypothetical protein
MATLAQLITARDALRLARLNGLREVRDESGVTLQYKSEAEMAAALAAVERDIAALTGHTMPKTILFQTTKGL